MPIDRESIQQMLTKKPRRYRLADFNQQPLQPPGESRQDWMLTFPFSETFISAFKMVSEVNHIQFRRNPQGSYCYTFLKNVTDANIEQIRSWLAITSQYVGLRDCLTLSFALDYDKEGGDPNKPQTKIGKLRSRAKPYNSPVTSDTFTAADELIEACLEFLQSVICYDLVESVVAMPASKPNKPFDLPCYIAKGIARGWGKTDLSDALRTVKQREPIKNIALKDKLQALENTIQVNPDSFKGKTVLLVDDLYQSGVSINYVAMLLLEAGAKDVFGLACEKTCRNDDNVSSREGR